MDGVEQQLRREIQGRTWKSPEEAGLLDHPEPDDDPDPDENPVRPNSPPALARSQTVKARTLPALAEAYR